MSDLKVSGKRNRVVTLPQALKGFIPAVKTAWLYTLIGLLLGVLLFGSEYVLAKLLGPDAFLVRLSEHLGVGFWVAAIAVFL